MKLTATTKLAAVRNVACLPLLLALGALAIGLGGCGRTTLRGVTQDELASGAEPYFNVGDVTYQIQISRQLNPFSYDVQYLAGVKGAQDITANQLWYGVFLWAKNQTPQTRHTADRFEIVDSAGTVFEPTPLNPSINPFAWTSEALGQNGIEPAIGSVAGSDSAGGGLILFKLTNAIYSNRPLTLEIFQPGDPKPGMVSLDL